MMIEKNGPLQNCSVVVIGDFNPAILHPDWFSRHSIMPDGEVEALITESKKTEIPEIGIILEYGQKFSVSNTQAHVSFKSVLLRATRQRFQVSCAKRTDFSLLADFIRKVFRILEQTPISAFGINYDEHLKFSYRGEIGNKLFTKKKLINSIFGGDTQIGHKIFAKIAGGNLTLLIEPSTKVENATAVNANFHYEKEGMDTRYLVNTFHDNFMESLEFMEKLILENFGGIADQTD